MINHELLFLWKRALSSEFGISIRVPEDDLKALQGALYEARRGLREFQSISVCMVGGEAWLVKDTVLKVGHGTARRADPEGTG